MVIIHEKSFYFASKLNVGDDHVWASYRQAADATERATAAEGRAESESSAASAAKEERDLWIVRAEDAQHSASASRKGSITLTSNSNSNSGGPATQRVGVAEGL